MFSAYLINIQPYVLFPYLQKSPDAALTADIRHWVHMPWCTLDNGQCVAAVSQINLFYCEGLDSMSNTFKHGDWKIAICTLIKKKDGQC